MTKFSRSALKTLLINALGSTEHFTTNLDKVLKLAFDGHKGQFREMAEGKGRVPYIAHPVGVTIIAARYYRDAKLDDSLSDVLCACIAHDLLEDTYVSATQLLEASNARVVELVQILTKQSLSSAISRKERNQKFLNQIISGGRTATFIKVCDALHNISRPDQMPLYLLRKTIDKANNHYSKLLIRHEFCDELKTGYHSAIRKAENFELTSISRETKSFFETFEEAVEHCINISTSKVIEIHDGIRILKDITGALSVQCSSSEDYIENYLLPTVRARDNRQSKKIDRGKLLEDMNSREGIIRHSSGFHIGDLDSVRNVFSIPLEEGLLRDNAASVIVTTSNSNALAWVSRSTLYTLIQLLFRRLKNQRTKEILEFVESAQKMSLVISPKQVLELNLSQSWLNKLNKRIVAAERIKEDLYRYFASEEFSSANRSNLQDVKARVKEPSSIINKIQTRKYLELDEVEDLVGLRLICLNIPDVDIFTKKVIASVTSFGGEHLNSLEIVPTSLKTILPKSSAGYNGIHVCFDVPLDEKTKIGCEVQVRTVLQDAWSNLSAGMFYKKNIGKSKASRIRRELHSASDVLSSIDDRLAKLK